MAEPLTDREAHRPPETSGAAAESGAPGSDEARLRLVLDTANDAFVAIDPDGRIIDWNRQAELTFGWTRDEIIGRILAETLIPRSYRVAHSLGMERYLETGEARVLNKRLTLSALHKDGHEFPIELTIWPVRSGTALTFNAFVHDITQQVQDQELQTRLAAIVESSTVAIVGTDMEGAVTSWNAAAEALYGYPADEVVGRSVAVLMPRDREDEREAILERIRHGERVEIFETVRQRKDGQLVDVSLTISPITDAAGGVIGAATMAQDIGLHKRMEEALRQAQKTDSLGMLAGGVAHDLNNLLVAMLSHGALALASLPDDSPARDHLVKTVTAAERAADLARQMLAYSGRGVFEIHPTNVNELIRGNLHLLQAAVPKHIHFRTDLAAGLPPILADIGQLQQVIMNLVLNAVEAVGDSPGVVTIMTGIRDIRQHSPAFWGLTGHRLREGRYVYLEVHDTGCGMDNETQTKILDPFFTTKGPGRGMGLASVVGIVRALEGSLLVYSHPDRGTVFKLLFPASAHEPTANPAPLDLPVVSEGHVLVVDDEPMVREVVTAILEGEGLEVISAPDGQAGIDLFRQHAGELLLVILDLSMPGMSGEETFAALRALDPSVPVLLSSGYSETEATHKFGDVAPAGFIQKPYDPSSLIQAVRHAVHQAR